MTCKSIVVPGANTDTGFTLSIEFTDVDGVAIDKSAGTYIADLYDSKGGTSQYQFGASGAGSVTVSGTDNEIMNFTASDTHGLAAGTYYFQVNRTDGGAEWTASVTLKIAPKGGLSEFSAQGVI